MLEEIVVLLDKLEKAYIEHDQLKEELKYVQRDCRIGLDSKLELVRKYTQLSVRRTKLVDLVTELVETSEVVYSHPEGCPRCKVNKALRVVLDKAKRELS